MDAWDGAGQCGQDVRGQEWRAAGRHNPDGHAGGRHVSGSSTIPPGQHSLWERD
ncbi:hypothetical protein BC831DRAFT_465840, partial [Entophlyctis helioformis]